MDPRLDQSAVTTIRTLAIDTVQAANSGHPGAPMGCAPMGHTIWSRHLRHAPATPGWFNRDRFLLSNGHASALLYSLIHLAGYGLTLDDLRAFRQWGSLTPGHPEFGLTAGVEATTGPLGQGFANGVGMAIAERRLAEEFNRAGHTVIDHRVFAIVSDGDLQEGIAAEAASLAGHLKLSKLIYLWDDNLIQLDGPTSTAWSEDVLKRFDAYGWHTARVEDGNDIEAIDRAIDWAIADERPSLIAVRTVIGFGSPNKAGSQKSHGAPLGPDEVKLTKAAYGVDPDATFVVPADVAALYKERSDHGAALVAAHAKQLLAYATAFPTEAAELQRRMAGTLPAGWESALPKYELGGDAPTRNVSQASIAALGAVLPELIGGSADLSESNLTDIHGGGKFTATESGRNISYGVREHAMAAIANGISYHGGLIPFVATFLTFSDYLRGALRLAALANIGSIFVFTHDSIGLGEDGPTHQPVEHYAALRAIPNVRFFRPGDPNEAAAAWGVAVERRHAPTVLAFTRQKLPVLAGSITGAAAGVRRGAYVLREATDAPKMILISTGSELHLAVAAAEQLEAVGTPTRVVSMPCPELFGEQDAAYRESVLPAALRARVAIEAGVSLGWDRWSGTDGAIIAMDRFGASAPAPTLFKEFGFTPERIVEIAKGVLAGSVHGVVPTPHLHDGHQVR
ncbi:MAG: transketolase [Chloroflexi bacterium]|nr:transketolase [Chloroflexota bacterium]